MVAKAAMAAASLLFECVFAHNNCVGLHVQFFPLSQLYVSTCEAKLKLFRHFPTAVRSKTSFHHLFSVSFFPLFVFFFSLFIFFFITTKCTLDLFARFALNFIAHKGGTKRFEKFGFVWHFDLHRVEWENAAVVLHQSQTQCRHHKSSPGTGTDTDTLLKHLFQLRVCELCDGHGTWDVAGT